jgi:hypothetical protein
MKTIKKAVCLATGTAETLNYYKPFYQQDRKLSSLKMQVGELLLFLQRPLSEAERGQCLRQLEAFLRAYYG